MKSRTVAYIELFLAAITWSSFFIFSKELEKVGLEPVNIISARMIFAALIYAAIALPLKLKIPSIIKNPLLITPGLTFFVAAVMIATGEEGQSPGLTAFIGFLVPIIISLFFLEKLHIKLSHLGIVSLIVAIIGFTLTGFGDEIRMNLSVIYTFIGACFAGLYFVTQKFLVKQHGPYVVTFFAFWGAVPIAIFFIPSFLGQVSLMNGYSWIMLMGLTIFSTLIPFFLYTHAMRDLGPAEGTAVNLLIPFAGSLLSFAIGGYGLTSISVIGGLLTLVGVCFYVFKGINRQDDPVK
ncbi:MAG: EamA family transporter [Ignavibacteriae bacterium]|nr:EamA family transporter [Ignavibacteriota bacterium]MCB9242129.1 EamA family transporter [Ignavibacteriales bacterium]